MKQMSSGTGQDTRYHKNVIPERRVILGIALAVLQGKCPHHGAERWNQKSVWQFP